MWTVVAYSYDRYLFTGTQKNVPGHILIILFETLRLSDKFLVVVHGLNLDKRTNTTIVVGLHGANTSPWFQPPRR